MSVIGLWRCPICEWVGYSVDGHCRQFDEHPDGPRIPLESVEYVPADQLTGAVEDRLTPGEAGALLNLVRDQGPAMDAESEALVAKLRRLAGGQ